MTVDLTAGGETDSFHEFVEVYEYPIWFSLCYAALITFDLISRTLVVGFQQAYFVSTRYDTSSACYLGIIYYYLLWMKFYGETYGLKCQLLACCCCSCDCNCQERCRKRCSTNGYYLYIGIVGILRFASYWLMPTGIVLFEHMFEDGTDRIYCRAVILGCYIYMIINLALIWRYYGEDDDLKIYNFENGRAEEVDYVLGIEITAACASGLTLLCFIAYVYGYTIRKVLKLPIQTTS